MFSLVSRKFLAMRNIALYSVFGLGQPKIEYADLKLSIGISCADVSLGCKSDGLSCQQLLSCYVLSPFPQREDIHSFRVCFTMQWDKMLSKEVIHWIFQKSYNFHILLDLLCSGNIKKSPLLYQLLFYETSSFLMIINQFLRHP